MCVYNYDYLYEYCMMGRWPLCTINFWIWIHGHKWQHLTGQQHAMYTSSTARSSVCLYHIGTQ